MDSDPRKDSALNDRTHPAPDHATLQRLAHASSLFRGLDEDTMAWIIDRAGTRIRLDPGTALMREGDAANSVYFVEHGALEVLKRNEREDSDHVIAEVPEGSVVGEVTLIDQGPRSATVRAAEPATVLALRVDDLEELAEPEHGPFTRMRLNLARDLAARLRGTNETSVRHLEARIREAETRAEMGGFMTRVLIATCLYVFAVVLVEPLRAALPNTQLISVMILLGFACAIYINIRSSRFPPSDYGFTTRNWWPALKEAFLFSLPLLGLIVMGKWALIQTVPSFADQPLFGLYRYKGNGPWTTVAIACGYASFVPLQEVVARSGIQSSLMMYLRHRRRRAIAIFMSTLLFSTTHLHTSAAFAFMVFPFGLFWGWLYDRHPTLIGVIVSHLLIGIFGVFVVSFPVL